MPALRAQLSIVGSAFAGVLVAKSYPTIGASLVFGLLALWAQVRALRAARIRRLVRCLSFTPGVDAAFDSEVNQHVAPYFLVRNAAR
jgi:hypothetical protein